MNKSRAESDFYFFTIKRYEWLKILRHFLFHDLTRRRIFRTFRQQACQSNNLHPCNAHGQCSWSCISESDARFVRGKRVAPLIAATSGWMNKQKARKLVRVVGIRNGGLLRRLGRGKCFCRACSMNYCDFFMALQACWMIDLFFTELCQVESIEVKYMEQGDKWYLR